MSPIEDAIWREVGADYLDEDLPHEWDAASRAHVLHEWAPGTAASIRQRLAPEQLREAVAILRAMSIDPRNHPVMQEALSVSRYAWFQSTERREMLVRLLETVADHLESMTPSGNTGSLI